MCGVAGLPAGTYQLGLHLPDSRAAMQGDAAVFAVRLANHEADVGWWTTEENGVVSGGVNVIGTVQVTPG